MIQVFTSIFKININGEKLHCISSGISLDLVFVNKNLSEERIIKKKTYIKITVFYCFCNHKLNYAASNV